MCNARRNGADLDLLPPSPIFASSTVLSPRARPPRVSVDQTPMNEGRYQSCRATHVFQAPRAVVSRLVVLTALQEHSITTTITLHRSCYLRQRSRKRASNDDRADDGERELHNRGGWEGEWMGFGSRAFITTQRRRPHEPGCYPTVPSLRLPRKNGNSIADRLARGPL